MRTTIDLPDKLFREVKATAAARGLKLKELVISALQTAICTPEMEKSQAQDVREKHRRMMREHFARMDEGRTQHESVGHFKRDELYDRGA